MKDIRMHACALILGVCLIVCLTGCMSVATSPVPRFYVLQAGDEGVVDQKIKIDPNMLVGVGPVKVPGYQDRPQMVTQSRAHLIQFAQFDRWGESLADGLGRVLREDLGMMVNGPRFTAYPWSQAMPVKYQVALEVVQLDSILDKDLFLVVQWQVIDVQNTKALMFKRSEFRQAISPQDHAGMVQALSVACVSLSREIAVALEALETQP
jgi:uncharacterized protein